MTAREVGDGDPIARFATAAERYCAWAESMPESADGEVDTAIRLLLELTTLALDLPDTYEEGEDLERPSTEAWHAVYGRFAVLPVGYYGTREPGDIVENEHLIGDLGDDLADIWREMRYGLDEYRRGGAGRACWMWKFNFRHHWGDHAAEALRVLLLTRHAR